MSGYRFGLIEVGDLHRIKKEQPDLYEKARSRLLLSCPDVFDEFPCYFYLLDDEQNIVCSVKTFLSSSFASISELECSNSTLFLLR